ncbi:hypothetical protein [Brevundimonas fontaquae]|uniref:Uncharacterized protein n=1 Tax=Brevundimonas fontaquae TaxID=2813778 RepID=A0ABX7LNA8_9CAUL|nr:hypothetical protein [Brevundimonas fontaquae]QSF54320.1 hypothetical protein JX001_00320 [Brevundimonas fontaquae]
MTHPSAKRIVGLYRDKADAGMTVEDDGAETPVWLARRAFLSAKWLLTIP